MNVWIKGDTTLTKPLVFDAEVKNVIITGKLSSTSDISFKVNNLVLFGEIITTKNISIKTKGNFYNSGSIKAGNLSIVSYDSVYNGLDDIAIEKIKALGVDLSKSPSGGLTVRIP